MSNRTLKRETESLICAAQEQAIRTNIIKGKIDKSQEQTKCRICRPESRRPDMIVIDKEHHECQILYFTIPYDTRVDDNKVEKIEKYLDLAREL